PHGLKTPVPSLAAGHPDRLRRDLWSKTNPAGGRTAFPPAGERSGRVSSEAHASGDGQTDEAEVIAGGPAEVFARSAGVATVEVELADEARTEEQLTVACHAAPLHTQLDFQDAQDVEPAALRFVDGEGAHIRCSLVAAAEEE